MLFFPFQILEHTVKVIIELRGVGLPRYTHLFYYLVPSTSLLFSHQFFGRAQARHLVPILFNDTPYGPVQFGIGDVAAVPGQQVLTAVNGGDRDVSSIACRFARDRPFRDQVLGQFQYLATDRQYRNLSKEFQALTSEQGVSSSYFLNHKLRNLQLELGAARFPPIARNLLMGGDQEIAARPSDQIARNRRFEV